MKKIQFIFFVLISFKSFSQNSPSFFFARTLGPLPFLEYGIGDDRLGGAKMTFLDSNILVRVVDSFKTKYKVQLSKNHSAFIDKKNINRVPLWNPKEYTTGNWRVFGDSAFDYVTVYLPEKLPYRSIQQIDPSRLEVDIFGAESNTNWITQLSTTQEIRNAYYEQNEDDVMRVIIDLNHNQHWGHSIFYEGNKLVIKIKRQPQSLDLKNLIIAIDAGHGGDNKGADGITSKALEKDYTLLIAKELEAALIRKKATVVMTREIDTSLSMLERIQFLRNKNPDMLISIHLNSSDVDSVQGVSTYYRYIGFRTLSVAILNKMKELGLKEYGNVGNFNFGLSGPTDYPNCLVEVAFLSNKEDEKKILDPSFHKIVAKKIVEGIEEFLKNL
jgi:N-acetylmuramoyl-L-alanine amidase